MTEREREVGCNWAAELKPEREAAAGRCVAAMRSYASFPFRGMRWTTSPCRIADDVLGASKARYVVEPVGSTPPRRASGFGAFRLFPYAPAKVPKLNRHRSLSLAGGMGLRAPFLPLPPSSTLSPSDFAKRGLSAALKKGTAPLSFFGSSGCGPSFCSPPISEHEPRICLPASFNVWSP